MTATTARPNPAASDPPADDTAASHPGASGPPAHRDWLAPFPLNVPLTLSVHRHGRDPTYRTDDSGAVWRTSLTPDGPGTLRVTGRPADGTTRVTAQAWGPGAAWLLDTLPAQLGAADDLTGFTAHHPVVADLVLRYPGLRVGRTAQALRGPGPRRPGAEGGGRRSAPRLALPAGPLRHLGSRPGPGRHARLPAAATWARIPSWDWHRAGVEGVRARTIITAAGVAARLEQALDLGPAETDRRLRALPGIGVWTSAEIRQRAAGDADAVSVGDYHLPKVVGWTLAGQITDDAGMLDLLAPYAGHRYRVTRLIELGGSAPPRRGPRMSIRDYRAF